MADEILMTKEGFEMMTEELETLKKVKLPEIISRIEAAIKLGDLSENAEYHEAKDDQGMISARIREIEAKLHKVKIVEKTSGSKVNIGSKITIVDEAGNEKTIEIVDQVQADPMSGKISNESPIGAALVNRLEGDNVEVELPAGMKTYKIKKVS